MDLIAGRTKAYQARRRRWIEQDACEELLQGLDTGRLPFCMVLRPARLPHAGQRHELAKREGRVRAQGLAADTINQFLAQSPEDRGTLDLGTLCKAITQVVWQSTSATDLGELVAPKASASTRSTA
jgi:hypothetical protein